MEHMPTGAAPRSRRRAGDRHAAICEAGAPITSGPLTTRIVGERYAPSVYSTVTLKRSSIRQSLSGVRAASTFGHSDVWSVSIFILR